MRNNQPGTMVREMRSYAVPDIRAETENGIIQGHAAVFGQKANIGGWYEEIIERDAFESTDFRDVVMTVNHNLKSIPLARSRNNQASSTLQLSVDDTGLFTRAELDIEHNAEARALHSAVARQDISGMSFIFYVGEHRWENLETDLPTRRILRIARVIEVSAVSFPAYAGTDLNARDQEAFQNARVLLDHARSERRNADMEFEMLKLRTQILSKG